jgi:glycosyltransferase involved in cell wall biosynthesis
MWRDIRLIVNADMRWPEGTGIGLVQASVVSRAPSDMSISDLKVGTRIGSPLSPASVALALSRRAVREGVFWNPGFVPPLWSSVPTVVTVHDLTHLHYYTRYHAAYYNAIMKPLYRRCAAIICVSEFTRSEFLNWSGISPAAVFTVHNGISGAFFVNHVEADLPYPYVLYVGNHRAYKNLERLIRAYSETSLPASGVHLVFTGDTNPHLQAVAMHYKVGSFLHFSGRVDNQSIVKLYQGARILAFVSLYEGFGLPLLEAMAAGVPVITSSVSAMPEIAQDAALFVEPTSTAAIAHGLECLNYDENLRSRLVRAGFLNARRFSWDATAAATWQIVRSVIN